MGCPRKWDMLPVRKRDVPDGLAGEGVPRLDGVADAADGEHVRRTHVLQLLRAERRLGGVGVRSGRVEAAEQLAGAAVEEEDGGVPLPEDGGAVTGDARRLLRDVDDR